MWQTDEERKARYKAVRICLSLSKNRRKHADRRILLPNLNEQEKGRKGKKSCKKVGRKRRGKVSSTAEDMCDGLTVKECLQLQLLGGTEMDCHCRGVPS